MNYNPQALAKEFQVTPYHILHSSFSKRSTKFRGKKMKVKQIPCVIYSFPACREIQCGPSKLSFMQGCMCVLFGPIPSWLFQIVHQVSLSEVLVLLWWILLLHLNFTWLPWVVSSPWGSMFPARLALHRAMEMSRSSLFSHRHFHDDTQMKIMWLTLFPICIVFPPPYRITMQPIIERWSQWETAFSSHNIFETGCSSLGLAHSLLDFK